MNYGNSIPLVYAHRGASGYEVENTFAAFDKALDMGADGLESDVYNTKDGVAFLFHDQKCNLKGEDEPFPVKKIYSTQLQDIILPNGQKVPTLEEFFERFAQKTTKAGQPIRFSIDAQMGGTGTTMAKLAVKYGCEDQLDVCHKFAYIFREVRKISPNVHLVASNSIRPLTFKTFQSKISKYRRFGINIFNIKAADFEDRFVSMITNAGYHYYIWDLHDETRLRKYLPYRPKWIYSNYPDLAVKIRSELFGQ
jgi:glycerophosphoryl diester phosphodiesterase